MCVCPVPFVASAIKAHTLFPMTLPYHPHDSFFKELFSHPEAAKDFVRHYLPPEVVAVLEPGR
jgi:hypothetical protein